MIKGYIYMLVSPEGKKYIGRTIDFERRMKQFSYKSRATSSPIYKEINKFGIDNFEKLIIDTIEGERDDVELQLNALEAKYIVEHNTVADGLNQNEYDSNNRNIRMSKEAREKMRIAQTGRKHSKKSIEKRSGANAYQSKRVYSDILNMTFNSLREAARYCGVSNGCKVSECISGKRKSAGKHPTTKQPITDWQYV